jgi:hypothetical protein
MAQCSCKGAEVERRAIKRPVLAVHTLLLLSECYLYCKVDMCKILHTLAPVSICGVDRSLEWESPFLKALFTIIRL